MEKKADKAKRENNRSISSLSAISKLFEKVVYSQSYEYFTKRNFSMKINMDLEQNIQQNLPSQN